jgi:hypothetical protein
MKSIVILLFFGLVGYVSYQYVINPVPVDAPIRPKVTEKSAEPSVSDAPPVTPDLTRIVIKNEPPITHARVKEVHPGGIVFVADQGMMMVGFDKLPEEFQAYYGPMAIPDVTPTPVSPSAAAEAAVAIAAAKPRPQRNSLEDAQAELAYAQRKAGLEDQMKRDREVIDRWYKQSSFDPQALTEQQYEVAQADYAVAEAQLVQLEANGP